MREISLVVSKADRTKHRARILQLILDAEETGAFAHALASHLYFQDRNLKLAGAVAERALRHHAKVLKPPHRARLERLTEAPLLLDWQPQAGRTARPQDWGDEGTILYVANQSYPEDSNGYAVRTHNVCKALAEIGADVHCASRPGYAMHRACEEPYYQQDGVHYRFVPGPDLNEVSDWRYIHTAVDHLLEVVDELRPRLIQAASSYVNGWVALLAARARGTPFVYEVRGFWEMTLAARHPEMSGSDRARVIRENDTRIALQADAVVTLTEGMRNELHCRGVPLDKMFVAANGVDVDEHSPGTGDKARLTEIGLNAELQTIAYIGSMVPYEGLSLLLESAAQLKNSGYEFNLLMVGDGSERKSLEELVTRLGLSERTVFTGRVPPEEARSFYDVIDICPIPRLPVQVSELISPLKPFEVMAQEKVVVASNVAAMAEFMLDGKNGLLFERGEVSSLTNALRQLLDEPAAAAQIGRTAREWVRANRTWTHTARDMLVAQQWSMRVAEGADTDIGDSVGGTPVSIVSKGKLIELAPDLAGWISVTVTVSPGSFQTRDREVVVDLECDATSAFPRTVDRALAYGLHFDPASRRLYAIGKMEAGLRTARVSFLKDEKWENLRLRIRANRGGHFYLFGEPVVSLNGAFPRGLQSSSGKLKVALIADTFTSAAVSDIAHCTPLSRKAYEAQIEAGDFDIFLCESAWSGNEEQWTRAVGWYSEAEFSDLARVLELFRARSVPTIFYNKEDPVHFQRFERTAKQFDYVITTDANCLPRYLGLPESKLKSGFAWPFFANRARQ